MRIASWFCIALLCGFGCGQGDSATSVEVRVFASASFTEAFQALAADYEGRHPKTKLTLHFAGTPRLALQLREGVSADVFASADRQSVAELCRQLGHADPGLTMASNRLVMAVRRGNPLEIRSLTHLARPDLRLALAGPEVPAGRYAQLALDNAEIQVQSLSDERSVRAALQKLALGEIDATLAYASDLVHFDLELESIELDTLQQVAIESVICVWPLSDRSDAAQQFVDYVLSTAGQKILRSHGFGAPAE